MDMLEMNRNYRLLYMIGLLWITKNLLMGYNMDSQEFYYYFILFIFENLNIIFIY